MLCLGNKTISPSILEKTEKTQFGLPIEYFSRFLINGNLQNSPNNFKITYTGVKNINSDALQYAWCYNKLTEVNFPDLESVSGNYACNNALSGTIITTLSFPKLKNFTTSSGQFINMCNSCKNLTTVSFPELTTIDGRGYGFQQTFNNCSSLSSVSFPKLSTITSTAVRSFYRCFNNCSSLTSISFPSLTNIGPSNAFEEMFLNCSNLTEIHFNSNAQSTITSLTGFNTKFGASNATIYFDL